MNKETRANNAMLMIATALCLYRWWFMIPAALAITAVLCANLLMPYQHRAEAVFYRRTAPFMAQVLKLSQPMRIADIEGSVRNDLTGEAAIDRLMNQLSAKCSQYEDQGRLDLDRLRNEIQRRLSVIAIDISPYYQRIHVSFVYEDTQLGQELVNTLIQDYLDRNISKIDSRLYKSRSYFESQALLYWSRVEELEDQKLAIEIRRANLLINGRYPQMTEGRPRGKLARLFAKRQSAAVRITMLEEFFNHASEMPDSSRVLDFFEETKFTNKRPWNINPLEQVIVADYMSKLPWLGYDPLKDGGSTWKTIDEQELAAMHVNIGSDDDVDFVPRVEPPGVSNNRDPIPFNRQRIMFQIALMDTRAELQFLKKENEVIESQIHNIRNKVFELSSAGKTYNELISQIDEAKRQANKWEQLQRRIEERLIAEISCGVQPALSGPYIWAIVEARFNTFYVLVCAALFGLVAGTLGVSCAYVCKHRAVEAVSIAHDLNIPLLGEVSEIISAKQLKLRNSACAFLYPIKGFAFAICMSATSVLVYWGADRVSTANLEFTSDPDTKPGEEIYDESPIDTSYHTPAPSPSVVYRPRS